MLRRVSVTTIPLLGYAFYSKPNKAEAKSTNTLVSAYKNIPHWEKAHRGGEDAWICTDSLVAVADGVGGWNRKGVDPGIFARELCSHVMNRYTTALRSHKRYEVDMWELLV
jgi:hypothetical protein